MKPEDFYTRLGVVTKFVLKDISGKKTDQWLMVGGLESTAWRKNRQDRIKVQLAESLGVEEAVDRDSDRDSAELLSKLVADWSFSETFTQEAVVDLLYNTPYILDELDRFVSNKATFFKKK